MAKVSISKSQKRLFIVLALLAAYAVYDLATSKPKIVPAKKAVTAAEPIETAAIVNVSAVAPVRWPREWKRDPFQKSFVSSMNLTQVVEALAAPNAGRYHLTAISRNGNKSYALINEQILAVGDAIDGFKVLEIHSTSVLLKKNDFRFTLSLPEEEYN